MKFGGTSVADLERIRRVARLVAAEAAAGDEVAVVVSAMAGRTNEAVAGAAALRPDRCDIYTDVDGVYTTDPRIEERAGRLASISYEEMLEMASLAARVLQSRSVELDMSQRVPLRVLSSFIEPGGGD